MPIPLETLRVKGSVEKFVWDGLGALIKAKKVKPKVLRPKSLTEIVQRAVNLYFDESLHPRDDSGKFTESGGGETSSTALVLEQKSSPYAEKWVPKWQEKPSPADFIAARDRSARGGYLSPLTESDLSGAELYLTKDGRVGGALQPDGDMGNLFNNGGPKGAATEVLLNMMANGGMTADCFDGYLPELYANFGLREVGRMTFNREFAPPNWNYERDGEPDVVFLARTVDAGTADAIRARVLGNRDNWTVRTQGTTYYDDYDEARRAATKTATDARRAGTFRLHGQATRPGVGRQARGSDPLASPPDRRPLTLTDILQRAIDLEWDESLHPRDEDGKFTESGGGREPIREATVAKAKAILREAEARPPEKQPLPPVEHSMTSLRQARELVAKNATASAILEALGPSAKQQFDALYISAKEADAQLADVLDEVRQALGSEAVISKGPIKGLQRAVEKIVNKDTGDVRNLHDPVRATVALDRTDHVLDVVASLSAALERKGGSIVDADDRFSKPTPSGYRDLQLHVRMPNGLIGEIQVNVKAMLEAKNGQGHKYYEEARRIAEKQTKTPSELQRLYELEQLSQKLYGDAWQRAGGR